MKALTDFFPFELAVVTHHVMYSGRPEVVAKFVRTLLSRAENRW